MKSIKITLILVLLALTFFLLKDFVYSKTETPDISLDSNPRCIAINPLTDQAVVVGKKPNTVFIIDLTTLTVLSTPSTDKKPRGVAIDPGLNLALVSCKDDPNLLVIDLDTYKITKTITVGESPEGIAVDPESHMALVANKENNSVSVIDLHTFNVIKTLPVGKNPKDVAIDPKLGLALVVNKGDDSVSVIDLETYDVANAVLASKKPSAVSINPETHLAVIANAKDNSVSVVNLQTWEMKIIPVDKRPFDVAVNQLNNRAVAVCEKAASLVLMDLNTNKIVDKYPLNKRSRGVAVNHLTNIAAVVDMETDSLTLIQLPNPVPETISITPDSVLRGSGATKIAIEGSRFIKRSTSSFLNPVPSPSHLDFIDNHHLQLEVPGELFVETGTHQLVITNPSPGGGPSSPVNLYVENPKPTLSALDPGTAIAGAEGLTLTVHGKGFFDDTTVSLNGKPRSFTLLSQTKLQIGLTATDLEVGGYLEVKASNPPPEGGESAPLTFTVLNPVPILSSLTPSSITAGGPGFILTLTGDNFVKTSGISFNNQPPSPATYKSKTQLEVDSPADAIKTPGEYPVEVINPEPGGGETTPLAFLVKPTFEVTLTSPLNGETINKAKTVIRGTIKSETRDVGIRVNGILAEINRNDWVVNDLPLATGTNTVTAVATDSYGNTDTKIININTNDIRQPVELSANTTSGIPPLQVRFSAFTSILPLLYRIDFDGDGAIDYEGATFDNVSYTYSSEGIFYPVLTAIDAFGQAHSDTIAITVLSKTEIDTLLKLKWDRMRGALATQDIEGAVLHFAPDTQDIYKNQFTALKPILPNILNELNTVQINLISVEEYIARYEILVARGGITFSFQLRFIKDTNGLWKIWKY